jgi:zinc transporter, ZIP family
VVRGSRDAVATLDRHDGPVPVNAGTVFVLALGTALATGLGATPMLLARSPDGRWLARANAAAAGFMLAASVALLAEGIAKDAARVALGAVLGVVAIGLTRRLLRHRKEVHVGSLRGIDAMKAFVLIAAMTAHSFAEGVGVGVAFGDGKALGIAITIAIAVHNIPEGLAISLVLVPRGAPVVAAAAWAIFSSLPQPLIAVPAFAFVEIFGALLPAGLGFAAGAMIWMVVSELLPEARTEGSRNEIVGWGALSFAAMMAFQVALGTL